MGKNLPSKTHSVGQPTQRYLRFILDHAPETVAGNNKSHFIDLARALSACNRRFYRAGLYYHVSGVTVHDSNQNAWVKFATAPDTWITKNAWIRGFRAWSKMNSRAAAAAGADDLAIAGSYHDFKVYLNDAHRSAPLLNPIGSRDYASVGGSFPEWILTPAADPFGCDEWTYSKFISEEPNTSDPQDVDTFDIKLLGDHIAGAGGADAYEAIGLIESYRESRVTVPEYSPILASGTSTDPIMNLFDSADTQDNILQDLEDDSDQPPYDWNYYPGQGTNQTVIVAQTANSAGAGAVTRTPGFVVPFGLLEIITNSPVAGQIEVVLEMTPGSYHGVAAARVV